MIDFVKLRVVPLYRIMGPLSSKIVASGNNHLRPLNCNKNGNKKIFRMSNISEIGADHRCRLVIGFRPPCFPFKGSR
jgi:hypothetical protein